MRALDDHQHDDAVQDDIRAEFRAVFATRPRDEWVATLGPADTCVSEVASVPEVVHDEHFRSRGTFVTARRHDGLTFEQVGWTLAGVDREQPAPVVRDPGFDDTEAVLAEAGFSAPEIAALRGEGVAP